MNLEFIILSITTKFLKISAKIYETNYLSSQQKIWICRYPTKKPKATATSTTHIPGSTVYRLRTTDLKQYFENSINRGSVPHLLSLKIMIKWKWSRSVVSDSLQSHDCSLPGFSVHGIFQARVLEGGAISFSRGSSWPRDRTQVFCIALTSEQPLKTKMFSEFRGLLQRSEKVVNVKSEIISRKQSYF